MPKGCRLESMIQDAGKGLAGGTNRGTLIQRMNGSLQLTYAHTISYCMYPSRLNKIFGIDMTTLIMISETGLPSANRHSPEQNSQTSRWWETSAHTSAKKRIVELYLSRTFKLAGVSSNHSEGSTQPRQAKS